MKAVVGFYGAYEMLAQWRHDRLARPRDQIVEKFLGALSNAGPDVCPSCDASVSSQQKAADLKAWRTWELGK